jgi:23S rRNA (uridine2552-2'-O)-methyltransferase
VHEAEVSYDRKDNYYRKAKKEGFAARSIYKLEELDKEFRLFSPSARVLDLGCAPGSWLQYVDAKLKSGTALGIDLLPVKAGFSGKIEVMQGDAFTTPVEEKGPFDLVLSDMAPNTTGIRAVDTARSLALCERALEVASRALKPGGNFCVKILEGGDMKQFVDSVKAMFETAKIKRPKSTRSSSTETYVLGLRKKP